MKRYAVIGDPIEHSLSPRIHNALYQTLELDARYEAIRVRQGALPAFLREARALRLSGFNATMPHKVDILPMLHSVLPEAVDSANTMRREGESWAGTSTDAAGLIDALDREGISVSGRRCLILGAGGLARALAPAMARAGVSEMIIANRTLPSAQACAQLVALRTGMTAGTCALEPDALEDAASRSDLVLQTTSLGMDGCADDFADTSFIACLPVGAVVIDTIYAPRETSLLKRARREGHRAINGLPMLVGQAVLAHAFWFGEMPPEEAVRRILSELEEG